MASLRPRNPSTNGNMHDGYQPVPRRRTSLRNINVEDANHPLRTTPISAPKSPPLSPSYRMRIPRREDLLWLTTALLLAVSTFAYTYSSNHGLEPKFKSSGPDVDGFYVPIGPSNLAEIPYLYSEIASNISFTDFNDYWYKPVWDNALYKTRDIIHHVVNNYDPPGEDLDSYLRRTDYALEHLHEHVSSYPQAVVDVLDGMKSLSAELINDLDQVREGQTTETKGLLKWLPGRSTYTKYFNQWMGSSINSSWCWFMKCKPRLEIIRRIYAKYMSSLLYPESAVKHRVTPLIVTINLGQSLLDEIEGIEDLSKKCRDKFQIQIENFQYEEFESDKTWRGEQEPTYTGQKGKRDIIRKAQHWIDHDFDRGRHLRPQVAKALKSTIQELISVRSRIMDKYETLLNLDNEMLDEFTVEDHIVAFEKAMNNFNYYYIKMKGNQAVGKFVGDKRGFFKRLFGLAAPQKDPILEQKMCVDTTRGCAEQDGPGFGIEEDWPRKDWKLMYD